MDGACLVLRSTTSAQVIVIDVLHNTEVGSRDPCVASQRPRNACHQAKVLQFCPSACRETPGIVQATPVGQNGTWTVASLWRGRLSEKGVAGLVGSAFALRYTACLCATPPKKKKKKCRKHEVERKLCRGAGPQPDSGRSKPCGDGAAKLGVGIGGLGPGLGLGVGLASAAWHQASASEGFAS